MKRIPLTQGKFALVDDADFEWLSKWKWHARKGPHTWYAGRQTARDNGRQRLIGMHVAILGVKPGFISDHKDRNGLNNTRKNLRFASKRNNCLNVGPRSASGYKGVYFQKHINKWQVSIVVKGDNRYFGVFKSKKEAAKKYDEMAKELFGEFAVLNFKEKN